MNTGNHEQLLREVTALVDELESVLNAGASATAEGLRDAQANARERLRRARDFLADQSEDVAHQVRTRARHLDHAVHEHPWLAIGSAVAAGVLLGLALSRRDRV